MYRGLTDAVEQSHKIKPEQIAKYRETIKMGEMKDKSDHYIMSDADIVEEMFGDEMADVAKRPKWLEQLHQNSPGVFDRIIAFFRQAVAKFKGMLQSTKGENTGSGQYSMLDPKQVKTLEYSLRNVLLSLKDKSGKRIAQDRTQFPYRELPAEMSAQYSQAIRDTHSRSKWNGIRKKAMIGCEPEGYNCPKWQHQIMTFLIQVY